MARYTTPEYRRLVEAFYRLGPDHQQVSRELGIDWRRARSVYLEGWPATKKTPAFRPIKDVIAEMKAAEPPPPPIPEELNPPLPDEPPKVVYVQVPAESPKAPELLPEVYPPLPPPPPPPVELPEPQPTVNPATSTDALRVTGQLLPPGSKIDKEMYLEPDELQKYAVKSIRQTLNALDIALNGVTGIAATATRLVGAYQPILANVKKDLELQAASGNVGPNAAADVIENLGNLNKALNGAAAAMKTIGEAKALALGQPTSILGLITPPPAKAATVEPDAQAEANRVVQALFSLGADPAAAPAEYQPETGGGSDNTDAED